MINTLSKLMGNSPKTISNWKKENRPIINLLKCFSKEELEEFLETGKMEKLENIDNNNYLEERCFKFYINLLRGFRKTTVRLIVDFIIEQNKINKKITIEQLVEFIFNSDNYFFKVPEVMSKTERGYYQETEEQFEWGTKYPTSTKKKFFFAKEFQKLDSIIFDYFCIHIEKLIELNKKRIIEIRKNTKLIGWDDD